MSDPLPSVSIIIPTLNAARVLRECLDAIAIQDYPRELVELIVADAGSTDGTREVAREYGALVVDNPLKTGEAGKAAALRHATKDLVALIDSDNILPDPGWLRAMAAPFANHDIFGSEPLEFTYRRTDPMITRYCALIGMNDPLCLFLGNYDRYSLVTGRWTGRDVPTTDEGGYLRLRLTHENLPTIGANGAIFRRAVLDALDIGDYFFDIDVTHQAVQAGYTHFAKVKTGIVHIYCTTTKTFARKQYRRARDYFYHQKEGTRSYPWETGTNRGLVRFIVSTVTVVPLLMQAWRGYRRRPDSAWLFHPLACIMTLAIYGYTTLRSRVSNTQLSRAAWSQ